SASRPMPSPRSRPRSTTSPEAEHRTSLRSTSLINGLLLDRFFGGTPTGGADTPQRKDHGSTLSSHLRAPARGDLRRLRTSVNLATSARYGAVECACVNRNALARRHGVSICHAVRRTRANVFTPAKRGGIDCDERAYHSAAAARLRVGNAS
ncbi:MAG: hypothetical protein M3Y40_03930, partial [Chloroflexota bacterium]|nr:hypothetical protein [Chloroflexota bacterium]